MTRRRVERRSWVAVLIGAAAIGCGAEERRAATDDPAAEVAATVEARQLVFRDEPGDRIIVVDAETDAVVRSLSPGEGGFLRGALRPLRRERARYGVESDLPYVLRLRTDGALILEDEPTGMVLDVAAFGASSREQFLTLLETTARANDVGPTTSN